MIMIKILVKFYSIAKIKTIYLPAEFYEKFYLITLQITYYRDVSKSSREIL